MDKNYNVDDILEEIKRRKARERAAAGSASRREASGSADPAPPPVKTVREHAPRAKPAPGERPPEEAPAPVKRVPPRESGPAAGGAPGRREAEGSVQAEIPIKKRPAAPPRQPDRREDDLSATASFAPPPRPKAGREAEGDGFVFQMPPVEKVDRNPLDFDGRVRPITDKAKIRRDRATGAAPEPEAPRKPPQVIDFSSFRPPAEDLEDRPQPDHRTRVLPKLDLNASGEYQIEDLRRIDFGAVAREEYADDFDYIDFEEDVADDLPLAPPADLGEYNSVADRSAVARDIARVKFWLVLRCLLSALLTGALFYLTLAGKYEMWLPDLFFERTSVTPLAGPMMITITLLSVLMALVNSSAVGGGLISLFRMRANSDTLAALALLAAIGQGVVGVIRSEEISVAGLGIYACIAALSMLFGAFGKTTMISRIQQNFRIIASEREKRAVLTVQSDEFCREFVHQDSSRRPTIAYSAKADFFTDFLALSYSDKYDVGINRGVAPVCLLGAALVSILSYLLSGDLLTAVSALTAILCVSATLSSAFIENIPLGKLTKKLAPQGGMVSGNKAVEDFCDMSAVVLREGDLFPTGHVALMGIKAFSGGRVDEAILDAASVICATESALSPVFLDMIGGNRKLLKKVDNIVYENAMGISAWVNSRRVLIGSRQLMETHGIAVSGADYEGQYGKENGEVLFLSNSGELSALFVVSYTIDEDLAVALDHLAVREKRLIIHTVNPHLTPHRMWELYGYPEELVDILPAELHGVYREMSAPRETAVAEIAYTGRAAVLVNALLACMSARASILAATVIQLVQITLGYGLIAFIAFMGAMSSLSELQLGVYQFFWFLAIFIVQKARSS